MKAYLEASFDRGFLLTEEHLIKLVGICKKMLREKGKEGHPMVKENETHWVSRGKIIWGMRDKVKDDAR